MASSGGALLGPATEYGLPPLGERVDRFHEVLIADATRSAFGFGVELRNEGVVSAQTQQPFRLRDGSGGRGDDFRRKGGNSVLERLRSNDFLDPIIIPYHTR
jgi:hypothetical protein